jgi:hypothetical protein
MLREHESPSIPQTEPQREQNSPLKEDPSAPAQSLNGHETTSDEDAEEAARLADLDWMPDPMPLRVVKTVTATVRHRIKHTPLPIDWDEDEQ